jgi:hypothetical protein
MQFTTAWDETKPAGSRSLNLGDDDIREFKAQLRERLAIDHYFLQNETDDTLVGFHKKVTLLEQASDPASLADAFYLYAKLQGSYSELFGRHENAGVQRLTNLGKLWINALGIDSAARGDIIVRGASLFDRLALGASGTFLKSDGTDAVWAAASVIASGLPAGVPIQIVTAEHAAHVSLGSSPIPVDDSKPLWNEGNEWSGIQIAITPAATTNIIVLIGLVHVGAAVSGVRPHVLALFQDPTGSDASKAVFYSSLDTGAIPVQIPIVYSQVAGVTSAITFKFRAGNADSVAFYSNGISSGRLFGGGLLSKVIALEFKAS